MSFGAGRGIRTPEAHKGHGLALKLTLKARASGPFFIMLIHSAIPAKVFLKAIPI